MVCIHITSNWQFSESKLERIALPPIAPLKSACRAHDRGLQQPAAEASCPFRGGRLFYFESDENMENIHRTCLEAAAQYAKQGNYRAGANIAGFLKVVNAMLDQGQV
jgi:hypothetical protein